VRRVGGGARCANSYTGCAQQVSHPITDSAERMDECRKSECSPHQNKRRCMGNTGAGGQLERVRSREKRGWKRTGVVDSAVVHRSQGLVAAVRSASRGRCDGQRNGF
jgi:hypothetical protein